MGSKVHQTLEKLYTDLQYQKHNTLQDLLTYLQSQWDNDWHDDITIVKTHYNKDNYLAMAKKYITDYYNHYQPFDQTKTLAIEARVTLTLDEEENITLQGYIDRLAEKEEGYIQIHDYKTNSHLPTDQHLQNDRQLALYALAIQHNYQDIKDIQLIWHYLAFDKELHSKRSPQQLEELKEQTKALIKKIEHTKDYPTNPSRLCDWCEYKTICKAHSHLYLLKEKEDNPYLKEEGQQLVDTYAELQEQKKQLTLDLYAQIDQLKEALLNYAEQNNIDTIYGTQNKIRISTKNYYKMPEKNSKKRQQLEETIKTQGIWEETVQLDSTKLNTKLKDYQWDQHTIENIKEHLTEASKKTLHLSKK